MLYASFCVAMQSLLAAAKPASTMSHDHQNGAQMSQELPSFHDWNQASRTPSTAASAASATSEGAAALCHQARPLSPTSAGPQVPVHPSTVLPSQLAPRLPSGDKSPKEAEKQLERDSDSQKPNALTVPQSSDTSGYAGGAEALNDGASAESEEEGMLTQSVQVSLCQSWVLRADCCGKIRVAMPVSGLSNSTETIIADRNVIVNVAMNHGQCCRYRLFCHHCHYHSALTIVSMTLTLLVMIFTSVYVLGIH